MADSLGIGGQIAGATAGGALGIASNAISNAIGIGQGEGSAKSMGLFNLQLQKNLWDYTNYENQVKHMKNAGLNVGLMSGGGGQGGSTNASSGNVQNTGGGGGIDGMALMLQAQLNKAQIENINADTKKKEVEANKLAGVDTEVGRAQIANLLQGVENQKAQEVLTQVQTRIGNAEANIKEMSIDNSVRYLKGLADYQEKEVERLTYDNYVSKNTADTKINMANAELVKVYLENALTKAQTDNTIQMTEESKQRILQKWSEVSQGWHNVKSNEIKAQSDKFMAELKAEYPGAFDVVGKGADSIVNGLTDFMNYLFGTERYKADYKKVN